MVGAGSDTLGRALQVPNLTGDKVLLGGQSSSWHCSQPPCSGAAPQQGLGGCPRQQNVGMGCVKQRRDANPAPAVLGAGGERALRGLCVPQAPAWSGTPRAA